jgi:hypothetical protein
MNKIVLVLLGLLILNSNHALAADEVPALATTAVSTETPQPQDVLPVIATESVSALDTTEAPIEDTVNPAPGAGETITTEEPGPTVAALAENLEFISGEITGIDEAAKSVTVKLYGETENAANDKILTVSIEGTTDITDGEKDRDLKSLTAGTEVDVEYDPKTGKATYIFVY